jgi:inner membrane protein
LPTVITHVVIGGLAAAAFGERENPKRLWTAAILVSVAPDADVIGFALGVRYGDFFGHRGFVHSPFFALLLALFLALVLFGDHRPFSRKWWAVLAFLFVVGASHGLLDAFTSGGLGIALLSPFDSRRIFMPWTPIPVSPIGLIDFMSPHGMQVLGYEELHIWLPLMAMVGGVLLARRLRRRRTSAFVK